MTQGNAPLRSIRNLQKNCRVIKRGKVKPMTMFLSVLRPIRKGK
jgi:hypothetical protein